MTAPPACSAGSWAAGVEALGLDETLFVRRGERHRKHRATVVVDVGGKGHDAKLVEVVEVVEVVEGRTAKEASAWIDAQPQAWWAGILWGTFDISGPYRKAFNDSLSGDAQDAHLFHVVKHASSKIVLLWLVGASSTRGEWPSGCVVEDLS